jgi:NAD(P)-dependent dehydrogenase (short-subunit alcohol dehydrogenase family)
MHSAAGERIQSPMSTKDPRKIHDQPPYSAKQQPPPGTEGEMAPQGDHGESSYQGSGLLKDRHALITGADSGIGRAVALAEMCEDVARQAIEAFGSIDVLINNAAFQRTYEEFEDIPEDEFEETFRVNIFAMFRLCKALLPQMKQGGSIINTGSIQSFDPSPTLIAYAATKAPIVSFTRSLAHLAIKHGVRVNAVAPGPVWTPLIPSTMPKEKVKQFGSQTVFGRAAQPAELAPIFVFLASDQASYVTGEVYRATGGQMPI